VCCWYDSLYYWSWFRIWTVSVVFAGWLSGFDHDLVTASLCVAWHLLVELSLGISLFGSFSIGTGNEADTTCGPTQIAPLYGLFVHFGWLACVLLLAGSCDPCLVTGLYQYWLVVVLMCEILACWIMLCLAPPPVLFLICTSTDRLILYDCACPDCFVELFFSLCYPNFDLMSLAVWVALNGLMGRLVLDLME
jgi:hypothetical protein